MMKEDAMKSTQEAQASALGRRDMLKMGVGLGVAAAANLLHASTTGQQQPKEAPNGASQDSPEEAARLASVRDGASKPVPGGPPYITPHGPQHRVAKYGDFMNKSGRLYGNGPMDETSRLIVSYAGSFKMDISDQLMLDVGHMLEDTIGCAISAIETDSIRAGVRLATCYPAGEMKSTVWGYGVTTTPDMAAFVNCCAVRHFDNNSAGMHETDMVPAILAAGEALHSSGAKVIEAMTLFWDVFSALLSAKYVAGAPGDRGVASTIDNHSHAAAAAVAVSWLMGLDEDRMANALALSFVDNMPLGIDHWEGPNSMSKSNHDAALAKNAIFAAMQARVGITGPAECFEGAKGLMDVITGRFDLKIPANVINDSGGYPTMPLELGDNRKCIQTIVYKRWPANGAGSNLFLVVPDILEFCKPEDVASIDMEVDKWGDGNGPGKMDPLNSETADHSTPYCFARLLLDRELTPASYEMEKLTDPKVRALMATMTQREEKGNRVTVRTKSGTEKVFVAGTKTEGRAEWQLATTSIDVMQKKFDANCAYRGVTEAQRDRIRRTWSDLRNVKDIAEPIRETLAVYGKRKPIESIGKSRI
jgi:2-methylcitrate dehydratase